MMKFPESDEYGEFYEKYIVKVKEEDIRALLMSQVEELLFYFKQIPKNKANTPYAEGKWTYKEILGHLLDTEKIMYFRALCIARNEKQALPGFDQDEYVRAIDFNEVPMADFLEDFELIRRSISYFVKHLQEGAISRKGMVNGSLTSVRALLFIIAGHFEHHLEILKSIPQTNAGK